MSGDVNLIDDDWLASVGFKWHQLERQPHRHWLLWLGNAIDGGRFTSYEDIGIEVTSGSMDGAWFCWLRSDAAGRYHRFIHLRHIRYRHELITICESISGQEWNPDHHHAGSMRTPKQMEYIRAQMDRFDQRLRRESHPWSEIEKDGTRGGALPEHLEAHEKTKRVP